MSEEYLTKILDEAIEEFEENPETIPFEKWQEKMREKYNIKI